MRTDLCQKCSNSNPVSNEETIIKTILKKYDIMFEENDRTTLNGKELDIYIPDKKIGIEINGLYYHSGSQQFIDTFGGATMDFDNKGKFRG